MCADCSETVALLEYHCQMPASKDHPKCTAQRKEKKRSDRQRNAIGTAQLRTNGLRGNGESQLCIHYTSIHVRSFSKIFLGIYLLKEIAFIPAFSFKNNKCFRNPLRKDKESRMP